MEDSGTAVNEEVTIIRVLGIELCARAILDYVPLKDLVRSETVSRQWQHVVNEYLRGQPLTLFDAHFDCGLWGDTQRDTHRELLMPLRDRDSHPLLPLLLKTLEKWGTAVVKVETNRYYGEYLEIIASKCPSLRHIEFREFLDVCVRFPNPIMKCKKLKQISLTHMIKITDEGLAEILMNMDCDIKFLFLKYIKPTSNWKSLSFHHCDSFSFSKLLPETQTLWNVTSFEWDCHDLVDFEEFEHVNFVLKKMPNLEYLSLSGYYHSYYVPNKFSTEFVDSFAQLNNLKCLKINGNSWATDAMDALLETLAQGCSKLEYVDVRYTHVGARGVAALCRMPQPMVIKLTIADNDLHLRTDNQVVARAKRMFLFRKLETLGIKLTWYPQMRRTRKCLGQETVVLKVGCTALHPGSTQHELKVLCGVEDYDGDTWQKINTPSVV